MRNVFLLLLLLVSLSCKKTARETTAEEQISVTLKEYRFDQAATSRLMFQDGEDIKIMTAEDRSFEIAKVLRVRAINDKTIEVANFAPVDIEEVTILMQMEGHAAPIKLLKIKKIRAHAIQQLLYPFCEQVQHFEDLTHKTIDLSVYQGSGLPVNKVSFNFDGESTQIRKLKALAKLKWTIRFQDFDIYDNPKDEWKENIEAKDIRRFTGLMINLGYVMQSEKARLAFIAEPLYNNDRILLTDSEKKQAYERFLSIPLFRCGVCVNAPGYAGGSTFGLGEVILKSHTTQEICFTAVHEMAHMLGYSHDSNLTFLSADGKGAVLPLALIYQDMISQKELPVLKTNYYTPSDL